MTIIVTLAGKIIADGYTTRPHLPKPISTNTRKVFSFYEHKAFELALGIGRHLLEYTTGLIISNTYTFCFYSHSCALSIYNLPSVSAVHIGSVNTRLDAQ